MRRPLDLLTVSFALAFTAGCPAPASNKAPAGNKASADEAAPAGPSAPANEGSPKAEAPADGAAPADAAPPPPADAGDSIARVQAMLDLDGPTMSAKVSWRDENRIRLMARLAKVPPATADGMIASLSGVDNDDIAKSFEDQFAERWHDMKGCTVAASTKPAPTMPGPEMLAKLPPDFAELAQKVQAASFVEVRCEADGRSYLLGLDAGGIISVRDTTPRAARK